MHVRMCVTQNQVIPVMSAKETNRDITTGYNVHIVTNDVLSLICAGCRELGNVLNNCQTCKKKKKNEFSLVMASAAQQKCCILCFIVYCSTHVQCGAGRDPSSTL